MNYNEAEEYLSSFVNYEQIPGTSYAQPGYDLRHLEELLRRMGGPQSGARTVHIAGTKGKGSVAAMVAQVLTSSGYRTGLYTSPHFHTLRERIRVDGGLITESEFAAATGELKPFVESMRQGVAFRQLTYFEALTALAFGYFQEQQVEFQVLEVGLGGRLDATNVVRPLVCVITPISLDHTQILGNSLEEIALEKAGIIKPGCWAVISPQPAEAEQVITEVCRAREARVVQVGKDITWVKTDGDLHQQSLVVTGRTGEYAIGIPLLGDYQLENAATAVAALEALASEGIAITPADIARGLARVKWPGRFHIVRENPTVLVDGAHNVASMSRLVSNVKAYFGGRRIILVFGTSCDKDIPGIVDELAGFTTEVVIAEASHSRAARYSAVAAEFRRIGIEPEQSDSTQGALERALGQAASGDLICVTGSLFLVAEALDYLSDN